MRMAEVYVEILRQAAAETSSRGDVAEGPVEDAQAFADAMFRLCVEFGTPWNDFKSSVHADLLAGAGTAPMSPLLAAAGDALPIVLLGLELMPEDQAY